MSSRVSHVNALAVAGFALLLGLSCAEKKRVTPPPVPAFLGIQVTPLGGPGIDPSLAQTYLEIAQGGFGCAQFDLGWGDAEPYLGVRDWREVTLHAIQARQRGIRLSCVLLLVDNQTGPEIPGHLPLDLATRGWNDAAVRIRLSYFLRELEEQLRPQLAYVWIGREVDAYMAQNLGEIHPFLQLVRACRDSLALTAPEVRVGTIVSYGEAFEAHRLWICDSLAGGVGWLGVTAYGRDPSYVQTLDPSGTILRARDAIAAFPANRVVLSEVGYPGHPSAREAQDAFGGFLVSLLSDPPDNLEGAFWYCEHDWAPAAARADALLKYLGQPVRAENYRLQLLSLGALEVTGVAKPVWGTLKDWNQSQSKETVAAGWRIVQ